MENYQAYLADRSRLSAKTLTTLLSKHQRNIRESNLQQLCISTQPNPTKANGGTTQPHPTYVLLYRYFLQIRTKPLTMRKTYAISLNPNTISVQPKRLLLLRPRCPLRADIRHFLLPLWITESTLPSKERYSRAINEVFPRQMCQLP